MSRDFESGSSQYLTNSGLPPGLNSGDPQPLSMSIWVMWESITAQIMGVYANDADNHFHRLQAGGTGGNKLQASSAAGGTTVNATTTGSMSTGTWYHCGATFGPTTGVDRRVYLTALGGTQEAVSNTTNRTPTVHRTALGAHYGLTPSGYMDGLLAHGAMWLAQLNDWEMLALSRGVSPFMIRPGSLICYWPLWGTASPELDIARGRLNLTLQGSPGQGRNPPVSAFFFDSAWSPSTIAAGGGETPTPGGALAGGFAPAASASSAIGGAAAAGAAPAPRTTLTVAGAAAAGTTPQPRTSVSQGGATAAGTSPAPQTTVTPGGAAAGGQTNAVIVPLTIGGAIAGGQLTDPLAGGTSETPTPGGALTGGFGPTASTTLAIAGAVAAGTAATATVTITPGGATAGGLGPTATTTLTIGGAVAAGTGATARAAVTPGGAIAGGQLNDPLAVLYVPVMFGRPSPSGGIGRGTPSPPELVGSPAGGIMEGTPSAAVYGPPSPMKGLP